MTQPDLSSAFASFSATGSAVRSQGRSGKIAPALACLVPLVLAGACRHEPVAPTRPEAGIQAADPVEFTHVCGNIFRVRYRESADAKLVIEGEGLAEPSVLRLAGRSGGRPYSEAYVVVRGSGPARLLESEIARATAARRGGSCAETPIPPPPPQDWHSSFRHDTLAYPVTPPNWFGMQLYREVVGIVFHENVTPRQFWAVLEAMDARIIGGVETPAYRKYDVEVPDPGPTEEHVRAMRARIKALPGVRWVISAQARSGGPAYLRYPVDGVVGRANWLSPTDVDTWAMRSIRAPLAWGCETGTYSQQRVKVGVIDFLFDLGSQDYSSSNVHFTPPPQHLLVFDTVTRPYKHRIHGTVVSAAMTARGDNGYGVAGMLWGSELYAFGFASVVDTAVVNRLVYFADHVLPAAESLGIRMLVNTMSLPFGSRDELDLLKAALASYLSSGTGKLFVQAVGNSGVTNTIADLQALTSNPAGGLVAAAELVTSTHPDHILIVAGSEPAGAGVQRWASSNEVVGATAIVAPAEDIPVLVPGNEGIPDDVDRLSGTSISAPLVAGLAGQLWAMDPTLTPAQVKDYIVRGATEPRRDPTTGTLVTPQPVTGFQSQIYQVDAYGSLSLLSSERNGTPICGFPVSSSGSSVYLERSPTGPPEVLSVGAQYGEVWITSVAQGGRRIALNWWDGGTNHTLVIDHQGAIISNIADVLGRYYLERDTVDVIYGVDPRPGGGFLPQFRLLRRDNPTPIMLDLYQRAVPEATGIRAVLYEFSPDGEWAAIGAHYVTGACGSEREARYHLIPLLSGAGQLVRAYPCGVDPDEESAIWTHDSQRALFSFPVVVWSGDHSTIVDVYTDLITASPGQASSTTRIDDWILARPAIAGDDAVLITRERDAADVCYRTLRPTLGIGSVISRTLEASPDLCYFWSAPRPVIPNAPRIAPIAAAKRHAPGAEPGSRAGAPWAGSTRASPMR